MFNFTKKSLKEPEAIQQEIVDAFERYYDAVSYTHLRAHET